MPDPYASIAEADVSLQARLSDVLELRAGDPQQRAMLHAYLSQLGVAQNAKALEVGCGTGAVSRAIVQFLKVGELIGVDPSPVFVARARELAKDLEGVRFLEGDGRALDFSDGSFDLVVFHTTLCHIPEPGRALREAHRVLRPGGWLAAFDGDYVTTTVATSDFDPLQPLVEAMIGNFVHNRWLTRRLPRTLASIGFDVRSVRSHGYTQTADPAYMLTIVERGADLLVAAGDLSAACAEGFKGEARRRAQVGEFFGHISYVSVIACKRN